MKSDDDIFDKLMEKVPFPEHLFPEKDKKTRDFFKRNWSGNIEELLKNCQK